MIFDQYASYYDIFYKDKEYKKEIQYLERLFKKYRKARTRTVLDVGCGTANHMIPLIERGYKVTGVDASSQMLGIAREKLSRAGLAADLVKGSSQTFAIDQKFDAVICLFSVINYAAANGDILKTLKNISAHMGKASIFIFDFWNANAVVDYYSPKKTRNFRRNGMDLERQSTTKIYPFQQRCEVNYTCTLRQKGRIVRRDQEKHVLKYFSTEEVAGCLHKAGLKVVDMHPFLNPGGKIRRNSWDVTAVAQKA
jgi:ubiquinone/menaquinone biosynthesis C-methylase UbiE